MLQRRRGLQPEHLQHLLILLVAPGAVRGIDVQRTQDSAAGGERNTTGIADIFVRRIGSRFPSGSTIDDMSEDGPAVMDDFFGDALDVARGLAELLGALREDRAARDALAPQQKDDAPVEREKFDGFARDALQKLI
jgi:hypothetical protein